MEHSDNTGGFDLESPNPFAYGTFGPSLMRFIPSFLSLFMTLYIYNKIIKGNSVGSIPSNGENMWTQQQNINNNNTAGLLSPSYSRRSRSGMSRSGIANSFAGSRIKRGSMTSTQQDLLFDLSNNNLLNTSSNNNNIYNNNNNNNNINSFLPISKYLIGFLTFICCILMADMVQMIVLYNLLDDDNNNYDKKYILIYIIFPFITFLFLKINDINICNQIIFLYDFGYQQIPILLNRNRQFIHLLTFIGFPILWIIYFLLNSKYIQSLSWYKQIMNININIINSVLISIWTIIQFIQFLLCIISLLYCIQHNIHQKKGVNYIGGGNKKQKRNFSFSITNPFNELSGNRQIINGYLTKIDILQRQISLLQNNLIKCKQENLQENNQLNIDYNDELQEKCQEYRALLSEKNLLKTENENKKSLLNMKKQQIKQQQISIKNLQQIREENIKTINELKKKLNILKKEIQKMQILLQIERQNVQKAQEYFENFT